MTEYIFASSNEHKVSEVQALLPPTIKIKSLKDISFSKELPEDHDNLRDNAIQKAETLYKLTSLDCFAEDTGLEVDALNGAPGVYSARFAGPQRNDEDNMKKLLELLESKNSRKARFRTVFSLIIKGKIHCFEGIVNGTIVFKKRGDGGFGYDPIFQPLGYAQTFAELGSAEKGKISHRSRALKKLVDFIEHNSMQETK